MDQRKGKFNYEKLLKEQKVMANRLDVPINEYTGPLEVKVDETTGRGLYATRDVKAGEILLAEKAMFVNKKREI